jgi:hypothetical protein
MKFRLPDEIPIEEWPKPEEFVEEAIRIVSYAEDNGVTLRVMGGLAIHIHSREYDKLWRDLGRLGEKVFTDIDLAGYSKQRDDLLKIMEELDYKIWKQSMYYFAGRRYIFFGKIPMVEVFFDNLSMNHNINLKDRLESDKYTLPLAELLMSKLQIVKINEKDIKDAILLLRAHDIGDDDDDRVNGKVIAEVMSRDWGFYYTFTSNLKTVLEKLDNYEALSQDDIKIVSDRINRLLSLIESKPKSLGWKMRAKVGTKKKWYNDVDEWIQF